MTKEVIVITGSKGSGKSSTAALFAPPTEMDKVCYVDTEDSASNIIKNLKELKKGFGAYVRMYERLQIKEDLLDSIAHNKLPWANEQQKSALVAYYTYFIERMNQTLVKGKFKYLVIDTVEPIEAGMAAWVESHRKESGWSGQRDHGKMEVEAVRPLYDGLLESFALRGVEYILITSHLKSVWLNDKPVPGKIEPGGRLALLSKLSSMMLWMSPEEGNPNGAPAAIVLKARRAKMSIVDNEWVLERPLPQRIPGFSWAKVRQYEKNGCDHKNPKEGETITQAEMDMISEYLTDAQLRLMTLGAETELEQIKAQQMPSISGEFSLDGNGTGLAPEAVEQIVKLAGEGLKPMQIKTQVSGVSIKDVLDTLKEVNGHTL